MRPICTGFTEASLGSLHALPHEVEAARQFEVEAAKQFDAMSAERSSNGLSSDRNRERRSSTTGSIHGAGEPTFLGDIAIKVSYVIKTHMVYHGGNTNPPHMLLRFFEERSPMAPTLMNICGTIELLQRD